MYRAVEAFQRAFGQTVADTPTLPDSTTRELRIRLLVEEFEEFNAADTAHDIIEIADALADMVYIACGTALTYGVAQKDFVLPFVAQDCGRPFLPRGAIRETISHVLGTDFFSYIRAEEHGSLAEIGTALNELVVSAIWSARSYGIALSDVFDEVHRSNMSKLGEDGRPIYREDGKIMKGPNYSPPDIRAALYRHVEHPSSGS